MRLKGTHPVAIPGSSTRPASRGRDVAHTRRIPVYLRRSDATYGERMRDAEEPAPSTWAAFLREITGRRDWSVARLARESGMHRSTIFRWMNGEVRSVTVETVKTIARAAGVDEAVALRAAGNLVETPLPDEDEESIRLIMESDASKYVKEELVREIRRLQQQHAEERVSFAQRLLDMARRVTRPT